ncbi:MAG: TVP38/TMEM64 family protein [Desulfovibrio sp.]|nr:MAG: TVP38/TMEM64 family protein [Desulfovibrio sp.]
MNRALVKRGVLVLVLAALMAAFFLLDLDQYLTLDYLKQSKQSFAELYAKHGLLLVAGYMALYIAVTALSLPGAAVLSLAGAALFGFWTGLVAISFASTIGATLACLVSRYVLRDVVENKFRDRLARINTGIQAEGSFYLFSLRLVPLFPFFVINLVMGLTTMRLFTFYWVSQLGMLPGTIVFVNTGTELGKIESLGDILSWRLLLSFALLGLFPLVIKKAMEWYRKRRGTPAEDQPIPETATKTPDQDS